MNLGVLVLRKLFVPVSQTSRYDPTGRESPFPEHAIIHEALGFMIHDQLWQPVLLSCIRNGHSPVFQTWHAFVEQSPTLLFAGNCLSAPLSTVSPRKSGIVSLTALPSCDSNLLGQCREEAKLSLLYEIEASLHSPGVSPPLSYPAFRIQE
ncbi:MAG: hypothetical protein Q9205_002564 [Flavoplaca limonia]